MGFKPSRYQGDIFAAVENPAFGHLLVEAVAGSGKTTTMVEALQKMQGRVLFCAFNKHIADELTRKLRERGITHVVVSTIHSLGFSAVRRALGRVKLEERKLANLLYENLSDAEADNKEFVSAVLRLADLVRLTLSDASDRESVEALIERYDVEANGDAERILEVLPKLMAAAIAEQHVIDFCDMIYLPHALSLRVDRYDWVCVDEAQDLSAAQRELVLKAVAPGGRIMAVGDRRQAIYGFAGADCESISKLTEVLKATVLPLSICYRCPSSHLDLARAIVPQIEAREDAPVGVIENLKLDEATRKMADGDLVICRINAPLAKIALALIRRGQKAIVRGRDIGAALLTLMDKHAGRGVELTDALRLLTEYAERECAKLIKLGREAKADALTDRVDTIFALADGAKTVAELRGRIRDIFSDDKAGVVCSSVHRAKGLEAERVFIHRPELMPFPKAKKPEDIASEQNLRYVALTRAKQYLAFVTE